MTPKQKADIMAMNRDGLSIEEIAAATGINMTSVGVYLQKVEDIEEAQTKASHEEVKKTKGTTTMQLVKMKELRAQGMSYREIAEKLGMKESTVGYYLRKKEPAQAATCTDSEVRISPNISTSDNTTETSRCQGLSGISGLGCLESALDEWLGLGQEAEIVSVRADQTDSELVFEHEGEKYIMAFGRYEE